MLSVGRVCPVILKVEKMLFRYDNTGETDT